MFLAPIFNMHDYCYWTSVQGMKCGEHLLTGMQAKLIYKCCLCIVLGMPLLVMFTAVVGQVLQHIASCANGSQTMGEGS